MCGCKFKLVVYHNSSKTFVWSTKELRGLLLVSSPTIPPKKVMAFVEDSFLFHQGEIIGCETCILSVSKLLCRYVATPCITCIEM